MPQPAKRTSVGPKTVPVSRVISSRRADQVRKTGIATALTSRTVTARMR